jgi:hypothetical protein
MNPVSAWQNFYVIVGSSGGALIGIQFVVIVLIASTRRRTDVATISAFGTPTVVHFGGALTISAIMSAPWPSLFATSVVLTICGVGGLIYAAIVFHRAHRQTIYKPVSEDWLWYAILPCSIYAALTVAALLVRTTTQVALFVVAGAALSLLLIGIHNAWDTVTHIVVEALPGDATKPE